MYESYEQAQAEVEKLRQELYPNLYATNDENSDASKLETIAEDAADLTDTNNDFTEDTSEAHGSGSDDAVRGRMDDGEENISRSDDEGDDDEDEDGDGEPVSWKKIEIHSSYFKRILNFLHRSLRSSTKKSSQK